MSSLLTQDTTPNTPISAAERLQQARAVERAGGLPEAIKAYEGTIGDAERADDLAVLSEALRRLAVLRHHRDDHTSARELCQRAWDIATRARNDVLAAEALNTLGGLELTTGSITDARRSFLRALELGGDRSRELKARIEQNLGIVANIQGDLYEALKRYERSLAAYRACNDDHGCAIAYHNLGMVSADREQYDAADGYYRESFQVAERLGDVYLQALCLTNQAEVDVARQRFENARQNAERALALFDQIGTRGAKADAYRVIGMVYRETGRLVLAEARLRSAIDLAIEAASILNEAEASRELAVLYQLMGRNQESLRLLNTAHRLFRRLDARVDLVHVGGRVQALETTYLGVVRSWAHSIESRDTYTFGHSERVAQNAAALARLMNLDDQERTTILLGSYLHDIGMVLVPHEILRKPGQLTREETEIVRMHPTWGIELLGSVDFPWDLKPIIRWHHERYDGTGYPDRLKGDEIPLGAQIVGLCDVFDAMMTARAHQPGMTVDEAVERLKLSRVWWSPAVFEAFLKLVQESPETPPAS